ncbi:MAG: diguanylate cyclase [Chloroflexi bacterium]|nr:diguanylate cyclase [Chloroflexota bacterium]
MAVYGWRRRRSVPGGYVFVLITAATSLWAFSEGMESVSADLPSRLLWAKITYLGVVNLPPLWLYFAFKHTRHDKDLSWHKVLAIWLVPLTTLLLALTNESHGLMWRGYLPVPGTNEVIYLPGLWFWVSVAYSYALMAVGTAVMAVATLRARDLYRKQFAVILICAVIPWVANVAYVFHFSPLPGVDLTPLSFTLTGLLLAFGYLELHLFELLPVSIDSLVSNFPDGVQVMDAQNRVIEINPVARRFLDVQGNPIGRPAADLLQKVPGLVEFYDQAPPTACVHKVFINPGFRYLRAEISPIYEQNGHFAGRAIAYHDVTERLHTEERLAWELEMNAAQAELSRQILSELDGEDLIRRMTERARHLSRSEVGMIGILVEGELGEGEQISPRMFLQSGEIGFEDPGLLALWERARGSHTTLAICLPGDEGKRIVTAEVGERRFLCVPILLEERWIGQIALADADHAYTERDHELLQRLANLYAIYYRRQKAETDLVISREQLAIVNMIVRSVSAKLELNEFLKVVDQQVNRFIDARAFLIAEYDPGEETWVPRYLKDPRVHTHHESYPMNDGLAGYVIKNRESVCLNSMAALTEFFRNTGIHPLGSMPCAIMGVPLVVGDRAIGALLAQNYEQENCYTPDIFQLFTMIGSPVAIAFENARLFTRMEQLATIDALTNLYNRHHFFKLAEIELERSQRYDCPFSLVMIDIDHFKQTNDTYGHIVGDMVLRAVANACRKTLRKVDVIGRYGGEEIMALLPETDEEAAHLTAERLRRSIENMRVYLDAGSPVQVTASLGVTTLHSGEEASLPVLLDRADQAMYMAKRLGRNRVVDFAGMHL